MKYKPKAHYRRRTGHRQAFTELRIEKIEVGGPAAPGETGTGENAARPARPPPGASPGPQDSGVVVERSLVFIDKARIHIKAGDGGNGVVSFRREKFVPKGGPDGGDGGRGGAVIVVAAPGLSTLLDFQYRQHLKAGRGRHGEGSDRHGRDGEDVVVTVPVGTVLRDSEKKQGIADLTEAGRPVVVARGGKGRPGASFASPTAAVSSWRRSQG